MDLFGGVVGKDKMDDIDNVNILRFRSRMFDNIVNKVIIGFI